MSNGVTYKIVEYGDGYALVERKDLHATSTCVPLTIEQETKSGIDAACLAGGELQALRKRAARDLVEEILANFIQNDPATSSLSLARIRLEELITASIAELRKNAGIKNTPDSSAARARKGETAEQCVARKMQKASQDL